jgi:hypothetical protein
MVSTECNRQLELFEVGRQVVTVDFEGGDVVSDAGLLPIRQLDQQLGILAEAARRLPDPRSPLLIKHSVESLLSQRVYQILAGYPDGNDAQLLKHDPLFKTCAGKSPSSDAPLASGSTLNRFLHAYTRREHEKPLADRSTLFECRDAQLQRIRGLNEFLVDVFARTRKKTQAHVIIDLDPTDDTCHGHQQLSFWHGYYDQNQYFPMLVFDGETGLPLAAWLRPGKLHAACGAVEIVQEIVTRLRAHFPNVTIFVRGDCGVASPEMYEFCEAEGLLYAFGYASNEVLKRRVAEAELEHEAKLLWWITRRPSQVFGSFEDYQAGTWSRPRRVIAKAEITEAGGLNTRFVVSNLSGHPAGIYHGFYVQRGNVPERPIGELKNGLAMDRLSSSRFLANSQKLLVHVLAYLLWSLFREANAEVPELAKMEVGTARVRLFKVGALVQSTARRVWFHLASHWPGQSLYARAATAVRQFVDQLHESWRSRGWVLEPRWNDPKDRLRIVFVPPPLK